MGLIKPDDGFADAFLSYAHADNDFHDGFVRRFRDKLLIMYNAKAQTELKNANILSEEIVPDLFVDWEGLPSSGKINVKLKNWVKNSFSLIIFVGDAYLLSDYCAKELQWFLETHCEEACDRVFMIMLSPNAEKKTE